MCGWLLSKGKKQRGEEGRGYATGTVVANVIIHDKGSTRGEATKIMILRGIRQIK